MSGTPRVRVRMRPTMDYGRHLARPIPGSNHIRYVSDTGAVRLTSDVPVAYLSSEGQFVLTRPMTLIIHADETFPNAIEDVWFAFLRSTGSTGSIGSATSRFPSSGRTRSSARR